jgi:hypothetical protein
MTESSEARKRMSSTSFRVYLTKAASIKVTFGWMILN